MATNLRTTKKPYFVYERGDFPRFIAGQRLSKWQNLASDSISSIIVQNVMYPLDVATSLMQTKSPDARDGIIPTLQHLHKSYGFTGLYRGNIISNVYHTTLSVSLFAMKHLLRDLKFDNKLFESVVSYAPSYILVSLLYPLQTIRIRMLTNPSKYRTTIQSLKRVFEEEGLSGLFRGFGFSLCETVPPMITTMIGFELARVFFKKRLALTPGENIAFAIMGTFFAAALHHPIETAKKVVQANLKTQESDSVVTALTDIGENHGIVGLWKGFSGRVLMIPSLILHRAIFQLTEGYFLNLVPT